MDILFKVSVSIVVISIMLFLNLLVAENPPDFIKKFKIGVEVALRLIAFVIIMGFIWGCIGILGYAFIIFLIKFVRSNLTL